ncbi:putative DNA mismatch repair protein Msh4 [Talaromyces proteolyticus]|uniref:DNA mismatch repair protein Msh4 n=1 Tax=Talaromyces proteolyticus TaxID=1131652 RepID=A0AAD4Q4W0_9EURO|nr:putative DNA mismatch repair protein Msh4 [Talaromyces proteolyticus]KAH8703415.1 putative DNA mismatch repair protein Msh4 [Talaromyces proteolyticus]
MLSIASPVPHRRTPTARSVLGHVTQITRPTTRATSIASQEVLCAVSESRGVSPTVGLAFVNLSTSEAVLCQVCDNNSYVRTINKIAVFEPTELLFMSTRSAQQTKLFGIIQEYIPDLIIHCVDRRYWSDRASHEYVDKLAFPAELDSIQLALENHYFAACCLAAVSKVLKYVELQLDMTFAYHSLRIKFEASQGSMLIDLSTVASLELIQNLQNSKSRDCLLGLLNETLTPMGARLLKTNILQPATEIEKIIARHDAVEEFSSKEELFYATRQALKGFVDADKVLTSIILNPVKLSIQYVEQSVNHVIALKSYIYSIKPVYEALAGADSALLLKIRDICAPSSYQSIKETIDRTLNEDVTFQSKPLDLRNQRTYAIKAGVNSLLDVARQAYKEANADASELVTALAEQHNLALNLKFDNVRHYYISLCVVEIDGPLPEEFVNIFRKKDRIECQTLDLVKLNQRISDSHHEVINMSDQTIQELIDEICQDVSILFKVSEAIATLDMLVAFSHLVTIEDYIRPEFTNVLAIKSGRHPIHEKIHKDKFVPNDTYAAQQSRFQIVTGCNMSGKSTYIRSIALMAIMAHIGSFVPADYASFPIIHQLFARAATVDELNASVSTFAAEMREMSFILQNIDPRSLVIVDELGRGTSTTDGLAIAIAIAEALVDSHALVWFATHFRDLAHILAGRTGVVNLHLAVQISEARKMTMLFKVQEGHVQEKFYGLALARVLPFPPQVLEIAQNVSEYLTTNAERRASSSKALATARKRKLVLLLREQLLQAYHGNIDGEDLRGWLQRLQEEFAMKMAAIEADLGQVPVESVEGIEGSRGIEEIDHHSPGEKVSEDNPFMPIEEFGSTLDDDMI